MRAQFFSGEITYEKRIIPTSDSLDIDQLRDAWLGDSFNYIISNGRYKSSYYKDGILTYSYLYDNESKRMYDERADKPYITFRDSRKTSVEPDQSQIFSDSITTILGHTAYMVAYESTNKTKTYYSDDIRVDASQYEGHQVGNWYNKLKEVNGAISLKTIIEHEGYTEITEVIDIKNRKVSDEEFQLPDKPIAANYTALDQPVQMDELTQEQLQCYVSKAKKVSKVNGSKYLSYVIFLVDKDGLVKFLEPYEKDGNEFYKTAIHIIQNCKFQFQPGQIDGQPVVSEVYLPLEFLK